MQFRQVEDTYTGISFGLDGSAFAGGRLGRSYSFGGLQKYRLIHYDPSQDKTLQQVVNATPAECQQKLADYAKHQRDLREIYDHFAPSALSQLGSDRDRGVALEAIAVGHSEREVVEIIRRGDTAQKMRYEFGQREELNYAWQIVQAQMTIWQRQVEEYQITQLKNGKRQSQRHYLQ